jgi:hypothetical protein
MHLDVRRVEGMEEEASNFECETVFLDSSERRDDECRFRASVRLNRYKWQGFLDVLWAVLSKKRILGTIFP